jgi:hypothetical protein
MADPGLVDRALQEMRRAINARRAWHYRACFLGEDGALTIHAEKMLADLNRFCRGNASCFDPDPRIHALIEGRREVLLRILEFLNVDSAVLAQLVEVKDE